jgi:TP901 family phage tail tape measure protein
VALELLDIALLIEAKTAGMEAFGETEGRLSGLGKAALAVGAIFGTALVAGIVESTKAAAEFQKQVTMIQTQANQKGANLTDIGNQFLTLAPQLGVQATDLATIYYHFASAGMDVATAMDATAQAAKLAKIGNSDYEDTAQAVVSVLSAYPQYAGNAEQATSTLNAIVGTGDMRMSQLAAAMSTGVLPAFATAKLSITDFGASLATITDNATPANEAATRLRMTVALLQHQSGPASDALASIGIKSGQLGADMVKPNGLLVAVSDLRDHLSAAFGPQALDQANQYISIMQNQGVDAANAYATSVHGAAEVINEAFGGGRTSAAIETLIGEFPKFESKYPAITAGVKDYATAWEATKNTVSFQWDQLTAGLNALEIRVGQVFLPLATMVIGPINNALGSLAGFIGDVQTAFEQANAPVVALRSHLTDVNSDVQTGRTVAQQFADKLHEMGSFIHDDVIPVLESLHKWFDEHILPILKQTGAYIRDELLPRLGDLASNFKENVLPALENVSGWLVDHFLAPLIDLTERIIPPVLDALKFLTDHVWLVEAALSALVARWLILQGIGIVTSVLEFAAAFRTMAGIEGVGAAIQAVLGLQTTIGEGLIPTVARAVAAMSGLGAAGEVAPAAVGAEQLALGLGGADAAAGAGVAGIFGVEALAGPVGWALAAGTALALVATDAGGTRTAVKNIFDPSMVGDLAPFVKQAQDNNHSILDDSAATNAAIAKIVDDYTATNGLITDQTVQKIDTMWKQGTITAQQALVELSTYVGSGFLPAIYASTSKMAQSWMAAAQSGQASWSDTLQKLITDPGIKALEASNAFLWNDYSTLVSTASANAAQAYIDNSQKMVDAQASQKDKITAAVTIMYQNLVDQGKEKQGQMQADVTASVNAQMAEWEKLNPQYADAARYVHQLAVDLGISDAAVVKMGLDNAAGIAELQGEASNAAAMAGDLKAAAVANAQRIAASAAAVATGGANVYGATGIRHMAGGGSASAYSPYFIGEQGPELFIPSTAGTVVPNNALGGGDVATALTSLAEQLSHLIGAVMSSGSNPDTLNELAQQTAVLRQIAAGVGGGLTTTNARAAAAARAA